MFFKKNRTAFLLFIVILIAGETVLFNGITLPIKVNFILAVNMMLFAMAYLNHLRLQRVDETNPNAMIRSVMMGTLLKLMVFAGGCINVCETSKRASGVSNFIN